MTHTTGPAAVDGISRRHALGGLSAITGGALAPAARADAGADAGAEPNPPAVETILWYAQPAAGWNEAVPIGNGRIGAMVHGGIDREYLTLNEDTFWAGGPYDPVNPEAAAAIPEIRRLIFAGKHAEAHEMVKTKVLAKPLRQMPYSVPATLVIERPGAAETPPPAAAAGQVRGITSAASPEELRRLVTPDKPATPVPGYRRELDLDRAMATTRWRREGVEYRREVVASPTDQVIAIRLSASGGAPVDADLRLETLVPGCRVGPGRPGEIVLAGHNNAAHGIAGALRFEVRVRAVATGGAVTVEGDRIAVRGAREAMVTVAIATSYRGFDDVAGDPGAATRARLDAAGSKGFARIAADSIAAHRALFRRVTLNLGRTAAAERPTDRRIRDQAADDPALAALYFNYARYLLISCSRPGGQPANLQGMWNDTLDPPWGSKYTININTQMNYWPAEPTNLAECVEPLVEMVRGMAVTGARTARAMYGASGWVCHHNTDLWRATAPVDQAIAGMWPMGGAWLCLHLWDHYDYGRDKKFLASVYPLLRGAAQFFVDTLQRDPGTGFMVTNPSSSPENDHGHGGAVCAGPTMDMSILRDLFEKTAKAADILRIDAPFAARLRTLRARLAPFKIGAQGQLQEWQEDWDADAKDPRHRHVSHLYALYPSDQITPERTPALAAAAKRTLETRGDESTGWATAWRVALWARLRDGNHARHVLGILMGKQRTYPNLLNAHPPFQIDGNFGGAAAIVEMLMTSGDGGIEFLPALPDAWPTGGITGLRARGGYEVDVFWRDGRLTKAVVRGRFAGDLSLKYGSRTRTVRMTPGKEVRVAGAELRLA